MKSLFILTVLFIAFSCANNSEKVNDLSVFELEIELGEKLFFDKRLSFDNEVSCATCHIPSKAFTDGLQVATGFDGRKGKRNTPSLFNLKDFSHFMLDGQVQTLEMQALVPIQDSNEMANDIADLFKLLSLDSVYDEYAYRIYNRKFDPYVLTRSLAAYERSLVSNQSRYDLFLSGDLELSPNEMKGQELFNDRLYCSSCHSGEHFTNNELRVNGFYDNRDLGAYLATGDSFDIGRFKVASLRNVSITGPYMHNGELESLDDVISYYSNGGSGNTNQDSVIVKFNLTRQEQADLKSFLICLTDTSFLNND